MIDITRIQRGMEVLGNDGEPVGIVDGIENGMELRLTSFDREDKLHHFLPLECIERVDQRIIYLNRTSNRAMAEWR